MMKQLRGLGHAVLGVLALTASAAAQGAPDQPAPAPATASNPVCVRLESQLATMDRGASDPAHVDQVKRAEDAAARQQAELDRVVAQSRRENCESVGFFSLFQSRSPQCGPLTAKIQDMRNNLDRVTSDLERLKSGNVDQDGQRRALIGQLAQNNCGAQYASAANTAGPRGFFDALFGGGTIVNPGGDGAPSGTYRTVCVRACDGFYFPISYSTVPSRFADDQHTCQRLCPASEVTLYSYRNPGEDMQQAVSASGQPYTALPNAFLYRKQFTAACSCRRPGQSWADALKNADDSNTIESGDIVVNDQKAKALSQAPVGKQPVGGAAASQPNASAATAASQPPADDADSDPKKRAVRAVGPPFMSTR